MIETSYTELRANLARLWDRATNDREVVIVKRRGSPDVALIAADELSSLEETAHLLRSPENARRLLGAIQRALAGEGKPQTIAELRRDVGIDEED